MPKSRIKNAVLSIFDQKCLIWVFLAWNLQTILSHLKPAPSTKMLKFGTKKSLVWVYFGWNLKTILPYLKSGNSTKIHEFGTKNVWFGYFWARIKKNPIAIFEISTLRFAYLHNFTKNRKCLNLRPKMPSLGILELEFEYNIVIFEITLLKFL